MADFRIVLHAKDYATGKSNQPLAEALLTWRTHGPGQRLVSQIARHTGTAINDWSIDITPIPGSITASRRSQKELQDATTELRRQRAERLVAQRRQQEAQQINRLQEERKAHEGSNTDTR